MKVLALDIETTGLDPYSDQILEVGMVVADLAPGRTDPLVFAELPTFRSPVQPPKGRVAGNVAALFMNASLIARIASGQGDPLEVVEGHCLAFIDVLFGEGAVVPVVGKNLWKLDLRFIERHMPKLIERVHHRVLDVGAMYARKSDAFVPGLGECIRRAGGDDASFGDPHDCIADCWRSLFCLARHWSLPCSFSSPLLDSYPTTSGSFATQRSTP